MTTSQLIKIATRQSPLALWQAEHIRQRLLTLYPEYQVELLPMTTQGDQLLGSPLAKIGGKGLFVKELEQALLDGRADLAVHSMKDVPVSFPSGLMLAVICEREDPRDAFVSHRYGSLAELPQGAIVGTASLRRSCQLKALRPDLNIVTLRGNVNTRLKKLADGLFDAIILASAGLLRLNLAEHIRSFIDINDSLPAVGQGALGIECRSDDLRIQQLLAPLEHPLTRQCVLAERALNRALNGGCQVPIAAYARLTADHNLQLLARVGSPDGRQLLQAEATSHLEQAEPLGEQVAQALISQGAAKILAEVYANQNLAGLKILVTRPLGQADNLLAQLQAQGAYTQHLPTLKITPLPLSIEPHELNHYQYAIFTSANAVNLAASLFSAWPKTLKVMAIGAKTAAALNQYNITVERQPEVSSSEGVLAQFHDELAGKALLLFKGEGGRTLLTERLQPREVKVYRRECPNLNMGNYLKQWQTQGLDLLLITSNDSLNNLLKLVGPTTWLKTIPLLALSQRIAAYAKTLGFTEVLVATETSDEGMIHAIRQWQQQRRPPNGSIE